MDCVRRDNAKNPDPNHTWIHVLPEPNDEGHELDLDCWCDPRVERQDRGSVVIHKRTH